MDSDLPEPPLQVQLREEPGSLHRDEQVLSVRQRKLVLDCLFVQGAVVNAHPPSGELTVKLLLREQNGRCVLRGARPDEASLEEGVDLLLQLFLQVLRDADCADRRRRQALGVDLVVHGVLLEQGREGGDRGWLELQGIEVLQDFREPCVDRHELDGLTLDSGVDVQEAVLVGGDEHCKA
eukprot:3681964-Rhodomonas_salina.1